MTNPWDRWDARVRQTGSLSRAVEALTNEEILNLLACESGSGYEVDKRVLKQEALLRLNRVPRDAASVEGDGPLIG